MPDRVTIRDQREFPPSKEISKHPDPGISFVKTFSHSGGGGKHFFL